MLKNYCKYFISQITKGQVEFYNNNGYLILENVVTNSMIDDLMERTDQLVQKADLVKNQITFQPLTIKGKSFLDTASSIDFLLEPGVIDDSKLTDKKLAINKMGHAMHDLDPVFERFSYNRQFMHILQALNYVSPILVQSMLIFKNQKYGTKVDMHTDNTYIISEPKLSCIGLWIALQDATKENGCMYGFPGSHKTPTTMFSVLKENKKETEYVGPQPNYEKIFKNEEAACLEVKKGSVICLHGDLVHYSGHNTSSIPRHAYTMHLIEGYKNKWSERAWLQRSPDLPFRDYYSTVAQVEQQQ